MLNLGVLVTPVQSMFFKPTLSTFKVTTWLAAENEFDVKNILSFGVGAQAVVLPPLEVAQWEESLQLPVPPIQYKFRGDCWVILTPELFPPSTELIAFKVPLPVNERSLILKFVPVTTPEKAKFIVAWLPELVDLSVITEQEELANDSVLDIVTVDPWVNSIEVPSPETERTPMVGDLFDSVRNLTFLPTIFNVSITPSK